MKNISSSPRWLWKGHERLPGGTTSYEKPRSFAPRSGPTRTASHSNLSPFAKCSSFNSSMLMTLESITLIGPPRLRLSPLRCPQKRGRNSRLGAARRRSSVDLPEDDVLGADDRDDVGDHVAARHLVERPEVGESRGTEFQTIRLVRAVRDDVDAELTLGMLDRRVRLAGRHVHAFGEELEVVDQLFHVQLHGLARRRRDLVVVDHGRPGVLAQPVDALADDPVGLAHLLHADEIAVVAVAGRPDRNVELHAVVDCIRLLFTQVPRHARAA